MIYDRKGFVSGFIVLIIGVFAILICYIATMIPYDLLHTIALDQANSLQSADLKNLILNTLGWADTIYIKTPLIVLFGLIILAILRGLKKEPTTYRLR